MLLFHPGDRDRDGGSTKNMSEVVLSVLAEVQRTWVQLPVDAGSQLTITPVLGDPAPSSDSVGTRHTHSIHTYVQTKHLHAYDENKLVFFHLFIF